MEPLDFSSFLKNGIPNKKRYRLKDNVRIYTGAIVVGGVVIEENSVIKAGRIVTSDIVTAKMRYES